MDGALGALQVLVGEWRGEVSADAWSVPPTRVSFAWDLDGRFLVERSEADAPVPSSVSVIALDGDGPGFTVHYFDTRGVVRLYAMTLTPTLWTLQRSAPDFTPLDFHQRYVGGIAPDGSAIRGAWETSDDGVAWERDFGLDYIRVAGTA